MPTSLTYRIDARPTDGSAEGKTFAQGFGEQFAEQFAEKFAAKFAEQFAEAFKPLVAKRRLLFLEGALGTGKTEIARALVQALTEKGSSEKGANEEETIVPSPTFAILQPYETKRGLVLHADLYRLRQEQTLDLGLEEALHEGFVIIEWAERLHPALSARLSGQAELFRLRLTYARAYASSSDKNDAVSERFAVLTLPQRFANKALRDLADKRENERHKEKFMQEKSVQKKSVQKKFGQKKSVRSQASAPPITRAFVLAAGLGTRMRCYARKPKPLVSVGGKPLLLHAIERLRAQGVEQIVVNAHYRADAIVKACEGLSRVTVLKEPMLLETGGGIERALPLFEEQPFFAVNADALWHDIDSTAHDAPPSSSLLACLEEGWQCLVQRQEKKFKEKGKEKRSEKEATALLALIKQQKNHPRNHPSNHPRNHQSSDDTAQNTHPDTQARDSQAYALEPDKPFPLVFPVAKCEHADDMRASFRYIGVQILTARAFRFFRSELVFPQQKSYSLTELYAHEATAGRLFGLALDEAWGGRWLHVGNPESLRQARRAWRHAERGGTPSVEARRAWKKLSERTRTRI